MQITIIKIPFLILARPFKEVLEKSKFVDKKGKQSKEITNLKNRLLYAQVSALKVDKILKLKADYSNLLAEKIKNVYNIIYNSGKVKLKINITTKGFLRKQIIVPIDNSNKSKFMLSSSTYITNINNILKNIKIDVRVDFVMSKPLGIIITMNKVASLSDTYIIENYIKNTEYIDSNNINVPHLP